MTSSLFHAARGATVVVFLVVAVVGCGGEARISYEKPPASIDRPEKSVAPAGGGIEESKPVVSHDTVG